MELKNVEKKGAGRVLVEQLRGREKGVITDGHPWNPFKVKYPRGCIQT